MGNGQSGIFLSPCARRQSRFVPKDLAEIINILKAAKLGHLRHRKATRLQQLLGKRNLAAEVLRKVRELKSGGKKAEGGQRYDI